MDRKDLEDLVRKYLAGTAAPEERSLVEAWYREMDSDHSIHSIHSARKIKRLKKGTLKKIDRRIGAVPVLEPAYKIRRLPRYAAVAAVFLLAVAGAALLYRRVAHPQEEYKTVYAGLGKVRKITLADGSQIWLNAASQLRFPTAFGNRGPREIFLEGEAYFEVTKDQDHPFLVHSRGLTTRVLGTRFNVNAYAEDSAVEVTLIEGRVQLSALRDTLLLDAHQKAFFTEGRLAMAHRNDTDNATTATAGRRPPPVLTRAEAVHAEDAAAWREGNLVFRNASLEAVIPRLERKFNIHIHSDTAFLHQRITVDIPPLLDANAAMLEITSRLRRTGHAHGYSMDQSVQYRREDSIVYLE